MKVAYAAIAGGKDYAKDAVRDRDARIADLVATARRFADEHLSLLVFPAGYLGVRSPSELVKVEQDVAWRMSEVAPAFGVAWGIDVGRGSKETRTRDEVGYPFYVSYRTPSGEIARFQQLSITAAEGRNADMETRWGRREVVLPGTKIALLICGESWSDTLLHYVERAEPRALVVAAHRNVNLRRDSVGMGRMSWHRRFRQLSKSGIPVVLAEHTRSPNRHMRAWPAAAAERRPDDKFPDRVSINVATFA